MLSSHGGILTIAMQHHGEENLIKLTHYDETKKKAHDSPEIFRAKEKLKLSHNGPSYRSNLHSLLCMSAWVDPGFLQRGFICIKVWGFALLFRFADFLSFFLKIP